MLIYFSHLSFGAFQANSEPFVFFFPLPELKSEGVKTKEEWRNILLYLLLLRYSHHHLQSRNQNPSLYLELESQASLKWLDSKRTASANIRMDQLLAEFISYLIQIIQSLTHFYS